MEIMKASVYCGTYHKYYEQSTIDGKWFELCQYENKAQFLAACRKYHNDEAAPEFMFQDHENIPVSMISESSISEDVFTVINAVKQMPEARRQTFYDFCEVQGLEQDKTALELFAAVKTTRSKSDPLIEEYMQAYIEEEGAGLADYIRKETAAVVKLQDGTMIRIEKPTIETSFCFGYGSLNGGETEEQAEELCEKAKEETYFISANLKGINGRISMFKDCSTLMLVAANNYRHEGKSRLRYYRFTRGPRQDNFYPDAEQYPEEICEEDKQKLLAALENVRAKFEKRLKTYYKRYGKKNIKTWTYWRDE